MHGQEKESEALERILVDASAEPIMLSYTFLKSITKNFSEDREIGIGGFGVVYMGIIRNMKVAIKKLSRIDDFSEKQFEDELRCLKRVKHKNIVRFLGYCSDTPKEVVEYNGTFVVAEYRRRFLCFEYVPNKSLHEYIKDESTECDWDTIYDLIEGVCQDFGLSRRFSGERSRIITEHIRGTLGYIAPEYLNKGEISFKTDIYSLGVIIMKLLIRRNDDLCGFEGLHKPADIECPRMEICVKIAQLCMDPDQHRRPTIDSIIDMLNVKETVNDNAVSSLEQESSYVSKLADEVQSISAPEGPLQQQLPDDGKVQSISVSAEPSQLQRIISSPMRSRSTRSTEIDFHETTSKKVIDSHRLEFYFPFKPNSRLQYPVTLTNGTDHYVGVWITPIGANLRMNGSLEYPCSFFFMKPNSTWVATVTMKKQQQLSSQDTCKFEMTMIVMRSEHDDSNLESLTGSDLLKLVEELGGN
ncbi:unnamed protein product [Urochloa humidicola]